MSDYDVVPVPGFSPLAQLPNNGQFTSLSRHVPALLSGNASEWDRMILLMIKAAERQVGKVGLYSDMLALAELARPLNRNFIASDVRVAGVTKTALSNDVSTACNGIKGFWNTHTKKTITKIYALHFSHSNLRKSLPNTTTNHALEEQRGSIMTRWFQQMTRCTT